MQTSTSLKLEVYSNAARRMSYYLASESAAKVDGLAHDRRDYQSLLMATAWKASVAFQKRGVSAPMEESRWVHRSMWNATRSLGRRRPKDKDCPQSVSGDELDAHADRSAYDPDSRIEAKQALALLAARMDPQDWALLQTAAEDMTRDEKLEATGLTRSDFYRQVDRARTSASRILKQAGVDCLGLFSGQSVISCDEDPVVNASRKSLTREADRLGLPYTDETTESEIEALVNARNAQLEKGTENMQANNVVQLPIAGLPSCFGTSWDGKTDPNCKTCAVNPRCLDKFIEKALPDLIAEVGSDSATISQFVEKRDKQALSVASIEFAMSYSQSQQAAGSAAPMGLPPLPPPPAPVVEEPKVTTEEAQTAPAAAPAAEPEAEAPPAPKATKKKAPKKAKAATEKKAAPVDPPPAGVATPVAPPAKKRAKSARTAQASARSRTKTKKGARTPRLPQHWGEHTFLPRWEREREREPKIAALTPGCKLTKMFRRQDEPKTADRKPYQVLAKTGYYLLVTWAGKPVAEPKKYATLQAVTDAIAGVKKYPKQKGANGRRPPGFRFMSNWSARRFWNLDRLLPKP